MKKVIAIALTLLAVSPFLCGLTIFLIEPQNQMLMSQRESAFTIRVAYQRTLTPVDEELKLGQFIDKLFLEEVNDSLLGGLAELSKYSYTALSIDGKDIGFDVYDRLQSSPIEVLASERDLNKLNAMPQIMDDILIRNYIDALFFGAASIFMLVLILFMAIFAIAEDYAQEYAMESLR